MYKKCVSKVIYAVFIGIMYLILFINAELLFGRIWKITLNELLRDFFFISILVIGVSLLWRVKWFRDRWNKFYQKHFIGQYPPKPWAIFILPEAVFPMEPDKLWKLKIPIKNKLIIILAMLIPAAGLICGIGVGFLTVFCFANFFGFQLPLDPLEALILVLAILLGGAIFYNSYKLQYRVVYRLVEKYTGKSIKEL